jgi:hypothetical protein
MASVGQWPWLNNAAPSLQLHYRAFVTTTGCSVPALRFGTLALAVGAACGLSLAIGEQVLTFHTKAWSSFAPPPCRMPLGQSQDIPQADPGGMATPRFWHRLSSFRHVISGLLAFASLDRACRNLVPAFPQRSPPRHLVAAACGGLRSAPDCRTRRALLHLSYSYAPPVLMAALVSHGQNLPSATHQTAGTFDDLVGAQQDTDAERVGHEFVVSAWPEPPNAKSAGARCGVQGTFAVGGIETPPNWPG